jgi:flagellin-like protein
MDRRGISPVIATVIIVAVTIAVSIAVAYWMGGLASFFTRFEKIEIGTAYATGTETTGFTIKLSEIKNTGSADATVTAVHINGKLTSEWSGITITPSPPQSIVSGGKLGTDGTMTITIPTSLSGKAPFTSGTTLSVTLHTASGKDYPVNVALP